MYDFDKYINLIKDRLSEHRFYHSMCVAKRARELAVKYGANPDKAYLAGILHDIMKEESLTVQREIIEADGTALSDVEINTPNVYHQMSGAAYVKNSLKIDDADIINGIRYHTTGRADMSLFEMIIYLADFTSDDRDYPDVEIMRAETDKSLLGGMVYSLRHTIIYIAQQTKQIHPDTLYCFNWAVGELNKQNIQE